LYVKIEFHLSLLLVPELIAFLVVLKPQSSAPVLNRNTSDSNLRGGLQRTGSDRNMGSQVGRPSTAGEKKKSGIDSLLEWCQKSAVGYSDVNITNFTTSWKDGLAFCALCHRYFPAMINFEECKSKSPHDRLTLAFEVASAHGVPALIDPEDIWDIPVPEKLSMITYIGVLYRGFVAKCGDITA
jgi:hypothetical protein